jgi:hypothetical protein
MQKIKETIILFSVFLMIIQSVYAISNVQHSVDGNKITLSYQGTPPFLINIRPDTNIGQNGGYLWAKTYSESFSYDMSFAINPSQKFYYGVKDTQWSTTNNFNLRQTQNDCQNLGGNVCEDYQVCDGTILSAVNSNKCCKGICKLPKSFDWRNRHGENWNTPARNQGEVASCTTFSPIGAIEAAINLYFNKHINVDLAEQATSSCNEEHYATCLFNESIIPEPGWPKVCQLDNSGFPIWKGAPAGDCFGVNAPTDQICKATFVGIPDEECIPYVNNRSIHFGHCGERICGNYSLRRWKVSGFGQLLSQSYIVSGWSLEKYPELNQVLISEDILKKTIILQGPVAVNGFIEGHSILVVGWKENEWVYKNSYGPYPPEEGYSYITNNNFDSISAGYVQYPVIQPQRMHYEIQCSDKDQDGFCNWGISKNKPSTCPTFCKTEKDWDDSDSKIGALGIY